MLIIGHRGARGEAPENTAGAFRFALDRGVRHFELDLRLSADGVPMVIHDPSTARTCGQQHLIEDTDAATLSALNAAYGTNWHQSEPIPSLVNLLPLLERCDSVQLEIKSDSPQRLNVLIKVVRQLLRHRNPRRYILTSFDKKALALARGLAPGLRRGLVCERRFADNIGHARRLGCELLVFHYRILSQRLIRKSHAAGLQVSSYTINDLAHMKKLRHWGIDSIITDRPAYYLHLQRRPRAAPGNAFG
jgi:glycerophosphoryl diester phosphodiesterase